MKDTFLPSIYAFDIGDIGEGVTLTESTYKDFKDLIKDGTSQRLRGSDFILVKKEGTLEFIHYSPFELKELIPSKEDDYTDLTFGDGLYVYPKDRHNINFNVKINIYTGIYTGVYYECVWDENAFLDKDIESDKGLNHEIVIKDMSIHIPVIKLN